MSISKLFERSRRSAMITLMILVSEESYYYCYWCRETQEASALQYRRGFHDDAGEEMNHCSASPDRRIERERERK